MSFVSTLYLRNCVIEQISRSSQTVMKIVPLIRTVDNEPSFL